MGGAPARGALLTAWLPVAIPFALICGTALPALLGTDADSYRVMVRGASRARLDPATALMLMRTLFALFCALGLWALIAPAVEQWRQRYRVTGLAVEVRAGRRRRGVAIADIRRVAVSSLGAWHLVRIFGPAKRPIGMLLGTRDAKGLLSVLEARGVTCGRLAAVELPVESVELEPGEPIRWRGRPGFASLDMTRMIVATAMLFPSVLFVALIVRIWSAGPHFMFGLILSMGAFGLCGATALGVLATYHERLRGWLYDLAATILVTDRRIAWCAPRSGLIYRELALSDVVDAAVVEQRGSRAWIGLTLNDAGRIREFDLRGVAEPDRFLAALKAG